MALKLESSITDLMTSLAVVFIMLMLALVNSQGSVGKGDIQNIQDQIKKSLLSEKLECKNNTNRGDPLSCTITLPQDKLRFIQGLANIDSDGYDFLKRVFPEILKVLIQDGIKDTVEGIYIEGFTDDDGDDDYNLQLSQNRAFSVGRLLITEIFPDKNDLKRSSLLEWLYLNGRGEQDLKCFEFQNDLNQDSSIKINKEASRRVEVTIRVKSLQQKNASPLSDLKKEVLESGKAS